ncbi:MAG TPA: autotransporter-associated beta strand repeat-containing protein [Bradyrhizobium sp.]|nr:autotransporter-associated beta strand repeat-containing protein [Bradyrhizobium sp.]
MRGIFVALTALIWAAPISAQNANWSTTPTVTGPIPSTFDFNANANWNPGTTPTGIATFGTSSGNNISFSSSTNVGGWTFAAGASNYAFTVNHLVGFTGVGIVLNGGSVTINNSNTVVFTNTSTAGSAVINNSRLVSFLGSSTAGSATISNNSDLGFFEASTAGNAAITNTFRLNFFENSTAGNAVITNSGVIDFSNSTGPHNDGKLSAGSIAGPGDYVLGSKQLTVGSNNLSTEVSGSISDYLFGGTAGGSLVKVGSGTLVLSGVNNYTGDTTISAGTLQLGNGGTTGSIIGNVTNNANFAINRSDTVVFGGTISGSGAFQQLGSGTTTLSGANTYTGATTIAAGTLALSGAGSIASSSGVVADGTFDISGGSGVSANFISIKSLSGSGIVLLGDRLLFLTNASGNFRGSIGGTNGGLLLLSGNETLSGVNSFGNTTITFGTLALAGAGSISSSVVTLNGTFDISGVSGTGTSIMSLTGSGNGKVAMGAKTLTLTNAFQDFAGVISGTGGLTLAAGTQRLSGVNTYTGTTTIASGTLQLSGTGSVASSSGIVANGTLDISRVSGTGTSIQSLTGTGNVALGARTLTLTNASSNFSGSVSGAGGVTLAAGTETLSGTNTYSGATNVNAGTLSVNGSIASSSLTTVNAGATLGGNGTVGNTTINGGTLAPGNSIGTLAVQGNLVFTAAASYMVEVSPANADRTNVTGTATLGGATVKASFAAGTYVARQYTILNATGGVSGTFNTLANTNLPANFKSSLSYDSNNAYLNLALNFIPPPGSGLNANQQSAANAIVGFFNSTGGIPLVFGGLTPAGLTQISGEVATGTQQATFNAMNQFMGVLTDPFIAGRGDPVSAGASAPQFAEESDAANAYA